MTYSEIKCIDESWLDTLLLTEEQYLDCLHFADNDYKSTQEKIKLLKEIKQHLTSATPILEKTYNKGRDYERNFGIINSFEQFLNTKVNI